MCGIGGIWRRGGGPVEHRDLRRMMSAMAHRGPEGAAFARLDRGAMLLGFLRLGFTAEGLAQQPLYNEDRSIALVYNGEIYDHEALRGELEARDHRFHTSSDSEVIIHLYEDDPEGFFERLNGEFSFVLWDAPRNELVLARDRFGVKPLHYAWHDGALVFASEAKGIHALDGFPVELDPAYWSGPGVGVAEPAMTPFRGVTSVRPGHVLRVSRDRHHEEPWFRPRFGAGADRPAPRSSTRPPRRCATCSRGPYEGGSTGTRRSRCRSRAASTRRSCAG